MLHILLIDNYDSFTHLLARYLTAGGQVTLDICKNDAFGLDHPGRYDAIVISPGPGVPSTSGAILEVIRMYSGRIPMLGICLGLQAIYEAFGGRLYNLDTVQHGVTSLVNIEDPDDPLFVGLASPFKAGRYHSWVCKENSIPSSILITARDQSGTIMAARHIDHPTYGVQFHPESVLTPEGDLMIRNFLDHVAALKS
jgi:anthranilate synthase component 2